MLKRLPQKLLPILFLLTTINAEAVTEFQVTVCASGCDYTGIGTAEGVLDNAGNLTNSTTFCGNWDGQSGDDIADNTAVSWDSGSSTGTLHHMTDSQYMLSVSAGSLADDDTVSDGSNTFNVDGVPDSCTVYIACGANETLTGDWNVNGFTTDSDNNVRVGVLEAYRHDGTPDTGCKVTSNTFYVIGPISDQWVTIEWFVVENTYNYNQPSTCPCVSTDDDYNEDYYTIRNLVVNNCNNAHETSICDGIKMGVYQSSNDAYCINNIVLNAENDGIFLPGTITNMEVRVFNNSVYGSGDDGIDCQSSTAVCRAQNNIVTDSGDNDYEGTWDTFTTNASEDATGTAGYQGYAAADEFVDAAGDDNLHLKAGATSIDNGADLGTTRGVNFDIDNRDRDAEGDTWDIGADEYVAAGPPPTGTPQAIINIF